MMFKNKYLIFPLIIFFQICTAGEFKAILEPKVRKIISTQMDGILLKSPLAGTRIKKEDILLSQSTDLLEAEAEQIFLNIKSLKIEEEYYRKLSAKKKEQFTEGFINAEELDAVRNEFSKVSIRIKTYEVELKKINLKISNSQVKSDIQGLISKQLKRQGEFSRSGEACIEVIDDSFLYAVFPFEFKNISELQKKSINVFVNGQKYQGLELKISPEVDPASGMVQIKVAIKNSSFKVLSGQKCLVQVIKGKNR